jgi:hypothetical protein
VWKTVKENHAPRPAPRVDTQINAGLAPPAESGLD